MLPDIITEAWLQKVLLVARNTTGVTNKPLKPLHVPQANHVNKMVLGKPDIHLKMNKVEPLLYMISKH